MAYNFPYAPNRTAKIQDFFLSKWKAIILNSSQIQVLNDYQQAGMGHMDLLQSCFFFISRVSKAKNSLKNKQNTTQQNVVFT